MSRAHDWIESWRRTDYHSAPILNADDRGILDASAHYKFTSVDEYRANHPFPNPDDKTLHLGLVPVPYLGDVQNASVYLLMLNPGFRPTDYYVEQNDTMFRNAAVVSATQQGQDPEFPFLSLNPRFSHHPGFAYWTRKSRFGWMVKALRNQMESDKEALSHIAQKVAVLQYCPYRSSRYGLSKRQAERLPSIDHAKDFLQTVVRKRIEDGAKLLAMRKVTDWNLDGIECAWQPENGGQARGGTFSDKTKAGRIIAEKLGVPMRSAGAS